MGRDAIEHLLDRGDHHADMLQTGPRHVDSLRGTVITTMFFEPSTRTRLSFEQAARFLGADVMTFDPDTSSTLKGESLEDTARTLAAIGSDLFVVRDTREDAPEVVRDATGLPVVNGGAGRREHPTQTLLDLLTLRRVLGGVSGLSVGIVGDVLNSRVAAGHLIAFPLLGAKLSLIGPPSLLPETAPEGVSLIDDLDSALPGLDAVYLLRVQRERGASTGFADDGAYAKAYGMNARRVGLLPPTAVVMHPGPINRGIEVDDSVADGPRSLIRMQVQMGVPLRMAVLEWCVGGMA
jgi:aspartate carbamoyltransferase catalytic subunit